MEIQFRSLRKSVRYTYIELLDPGIEPNIVPFVRTTQRPPVAGDDVATSRKAQIADTELNNLQGYTFAT